MFCPPYWQSGGTSNASQVRTGPWPVKIGLISFAPFTKVKKLVPRCFRESLSILASSPEIFSRIRSVPPNPVVNSDAPVYDFVLNERLWRRAGYLMR